MGLRWLLAHLRSFELIHFVGEVLKMYVNPFVAGVFVTIASEMILIFLYAIFNQKK